MKNMTAYQLGIQALFKKQRSDGAWIGEVELNPGPTAQVIMLFSKLGRALPAELMQKALQYIKRTQNEDGGWSPHLGAPSEVSLTTECYVALRLLGVSPDNSAAERARLTINRLGGINKCNTWTQLYLGVLGIRAWQNVQKIPIEIVLLPSWSPIHFKHLSYWVNVITIPMALLGAVGPGKPIVEALTLKDELEAEPTQGAPAESSSVLGSFMKNAGHIARKMFPNARRRAILEGLKKIEQFTESSGDFGGNTCTAMNVLLTLHILDREKDPRFENGLAALMSYGFETNSEWHVQTCQSHVWDTGFALTGIPPEDDYSSQTEPAIRWIRENQILSVRGQWASNVDALPGGWCFGNKHEHYPVTDCTAVALLALHRHGIRSLSDPTIRRGVEWLLSMQHGSGGFSAYQKYDRGRFLNKLLQFKDIPEALVDTPKVDVSAKVLEALALWRDEDSRIEPVLSRGREFLINQREKASSVEGLWRGNYGVNYIYGTAYAVTALRKIDKAAKAEWASRPRAFFLQTQNLDGGWGEPETSYRNSYDAGHFASSVVQTSWALIGLTACDDGSALVRDAIKRGTEFLIGRQKPDGTWYEDRYLGTVFPEVVYFKYELYPYYFPLIALEKSCAVNLPLV